MITVYIASPYTIGDKMENVMTQIRTADTLAMLGYLPFWPLSAHFWHILRPRAYDFWMKLDFEWIKKCDCVLRLPGESKGADQEVEYARVLGLPIFYDIRELHKQYLLETGDW